MREFHSTALTKLLAPCPVCKTSETLDLKYRERQFGGESYRVLCSCGVTGPERWSPEKAIAAYNTAALKPLAPTIGCECMTPDATKPKVQNPARRPAGHSAKARP